MTKKWPTCSYSVVICSRVSLICKSQCFTFPWMVVWFTSLPQTFSCLSTYFYFLTFVSPLPLSASSNHAYLQTPWALVTDRGRHGQSWSGCHMLDDTMGCMRRLPTWGGGRRLGSDTSINLQEMSVPYHALAPPPPLHLSFLLSAGLWLEDKHVVPWAKQPNNKYFHLLLSSTCGFKMTCFSHITLNYPLSHCSCLFPHLFRPIRPSLFLQSPPDSLAIQ